MSKEVKITWLGHSCFKIESEGFSIIVDPYKDGKVPGLKDLRVKANTVFCSHDHDDHGYVEAVDIQETDQDMPFTLTLVACPHDENGGMDRGMNMIHILDNGEVRLAHFGDIGCPLNEKQMEMIGACDLVMVPVGGHYTMEPEGIQEMLCELKPKVVIPMHYRTADFGFPVIRPLEDFLKMREDVVRYDTNEFILTKETEKQTAVLTYLG